MEKIPFNLKKGLIHVILFSEIKLTDGENISPIFTLHWSVKLSPKIVIKLPPFKIL